MKNPLPYLTARSMGQIPPDMTEAKYNFMLSRGQDPTAGGKGDVTPGDMVLRDRNDPHAKNAPLPYLTARAMGKIPPGMTEAKYNFMLSKGQDPFGVKGPVTPGADPFADPVVTDPNVVTPGGGQDGPQDSRYLEALRQANLRKNYDYSWALQGPQQSHMVDGNYSRAMSAAQADMNYRQALNLVNQSSYRGGMKAEDYQKLYDLSKSFSGMLDPNDPVRKVLTNMSMGRYDEWQPEPIKPTYTPPAVTGGENTVNGDGTSTMDAISQAYGTTQAPGDPNDPNYWRNYILNNRPVGSGGGMDQKGGPGPDPNIPVTDAVLPPVDGGGGHGIPSDTSRGGFDPYKNNGGTGPYNPDPTQPVVGGGTQLPDPYETTIAPPNPNQDQWGNNQVSWQPYTGYRPPGGGKGKDYLQGSGNFQPLNNAMTTSKTGGGWKSWGIG